MSDIEHALHPVYVGAPSSKHDPNPLLNKGEVKLAILGDAHAAHRRIVLVFTVRIEELYTSQT